jgi:N-acetyl-alpha-D-glucosaminyl L-malate synthase BshA
MGGSVRVAVGLASELARRGHAVSLFARSFPFGGKVATSGLSFQTLERGPRRRPPDWLDLEWSPHDLDSLVTRIVESARRDPFDVLHFHYAVPFAVVAEQVRYRLGNAAPVLVGTLHGTDVTVAGLDPDVRSLLAGVLSRLDATTTVSEAFAELSVAAFEIDRPAVIPNFIDPERFRPGRPTRRPHRLPRIAHVSNFRPSKDPDRIGRVFANVLRALPAELWLVGDGERLGSLNRVLSEQGVAGQVRWLGVRRDVHAVLPRTDVLLLTSRSESFSLAALEAAACGLPVVAPRVGGLPEVVADGRTGILYAAGDDDAAARALVRLLSDRSLAHRLGRDARARAARFSPVRVVPRYEALYRSLLAERTARA